MYRALILLAVLLLAQGQVPAPVGGDMSNTTVKATGGTTARTLAGRFPEVTAQDFNLTAGGGTADDTAAVQAAFNSTKPVFLIPGTYSVTCLTVPAGLALRGAGPAATKIVQRAGATCATLTGTSATDVSISGVTINANHTGANAILAQTNPARWRISNNTIQGTTAECVSIHSGTDLVISGNTLTDCGVGGVLLTSSAARFEVTDNNITNDDGPGIIFSIGIDGSIKGNTIQNPGPSGDCITGYHMSNLRVAVVGNNCSNSNNHGIHVGGTRITVADNNIEAYAATGIFIYCTTTGSHLDPPAISTQVTVTGNNVFNSTVANQIGIQLLDVTHSTVSGNNVGSATQNAIMPLLSSYLTITGNNVGPTTGNGIDLRGTQNSLISGNLVNGTTGDAFRAETDTSNVTGLGTVVATGNTLIGNASIGNNRDYIDVSGGNYFAFNNSTGATGGTSPMISIPAGSIWNGTAASATDLQLATVGGRQVLVKDSASTVNYVQLGGAATGAAPSILEAGADANRNLNISGKGTGVVAITPGNFYAAFATTLNGAVTMITLPTTCTAQPSKSVAAISGVLNLCP